MNTPISLATTIPCEHCATTGNMDSPDAVPCAADGTPVDALVTGMALGQEIPHAARSVETCWSCKGFTVRSRGMQPYKTKAIAERMLAARKATPCSTCKMTGYMLRILVWRQCYTCSGVGHLPIYTPGGILGEQWGRHDTMSKAAAEAFAREVNVHMAMRSSLTWGEAHMGLGCIYSTTDYGRAFDACKARHVALDREGMDDDAVMEAVFGPFKAEVRAKLADDRIQWSSIIDRETRVMTSDVAITLTRNGYTVKAVGVAQALPLLPPTYTPEVLNRPIGR